MSPISKAVEMLGGPSAAARKLGVTPQAVCFWRDGERAVTAERALAIERATGGAVRVEELCPDVDWDVLRERPAA